MNRQLYQYHPQIGYTFIPELKTRVPHENGGYLLRVNTTGFRSDFEFQSPKTSGKRRVLLFGDSFTAADGVSNAARYSDLLASQVSDLEVYNFGLSGTGTDQQYLIYREMASDIECDLVVIAVLVENIRRVAARYRTYQNTEGQRIVFAKPYFSVDTDGQLERHHCPVPRDAIPEDQLPEDQGQFVDRGGQLVWLRETVNKFGSVAKDLAQRVTRYQPLPAYDSPENEDWLLTKAILSQWISEVSVPVIVCPLPLYHYVEKMADPTAYQTRFRELGEETGARIHDPLPDFLKAPRSERRNYRFRTDIHPTPESHRVLAASLAPCIKSYLDQ